MKIVLVCKSCEEIAENFFRSVVYLAGHTGTVLTIETDSALLPGSYYYVMLKGVFPGFQDNRPCVSDSIRSLSLELGAKHVEILGFDQKQWCDFITERQSKGLLVW